MIVMPCAVARGKQPEQWLTPRRVPNSQAARGAKRAVHSLTLSSVDMKHKSFQHARRIDQLTVNDLAWFLRCLPDEEREQAIDLLRAIQDRHWREIWREPLILGDDG